MKAEIPGSDRLRFFISGLSGYRTLAELRASSFFQQCGSEVDGLLAVPDVTFCDRASPRLSGFVRVVQWNIEKGKRLDCILQVLRNDPTLKWADIILINEADIGMNRSGNSHVARCLAEELEMHAACGCAHIELTKGTDDELRAPGTNLTGLQGNAVLSRYPILDAVVVPLPVCFEPFEFHEKRYGRRICLWTRIGIGRHRGWFGSVHLEVRNTPDCRMAQMRHLLAHLPGNFDEPYLLGGDLNTNGFSRGNRLRALGSIWRLIGHSPESVQEELVHPERGAEPLFRAVREAGFCWQGLNSGESTASAPVGGLEEAAMLPAWIVSAVQKRLEPYGGQLDFKLDWLLGRGIRALGKGEGSDWETQVHSSGAGRIITPSTGPGRFSDHVPIFADILL